MGATLTKAEQMNAYTLTDKATYLSHEAKNKLKIALGESEDMKNTYSLIAVNPDKVPNLNTEGAQAFINWMTGDKGKELISKYGQEQYGESLFFLL